ncbi:hypothetical protein EXIGLDRAFT_735077 [Exidia glandulosa HHB12029]|uniref:Uncharacterized protein n=1 Tax=Exidia glandulosa HHB12029 TaxID=1314781 RepID=A0A165AUH8_EXIGL|nr:hypothetical protein EXIGLDRAFT_735077 [Exidia glandulosa HHB12029]
MVGKIFRFFVGFAESTAFPARRFLPIFFSSHSVLIASSARSLPLSLPNPIPTPLPELPTVTFPLTASASHFLHACIFILMMQSRSCEWISIAWREIRPSR